MADRVLFLSWGAPIAGREERSVEVFNDALGYYGRLQQEGRIERFDVALFGAHAGINGYMVLHGSHDQLDAVEEALQQRFPGTEILIHVDPEGQTDRETLLPQHLTEQAS